MLPFTALMMFVLVGFGGLVVDGGRAYLAHRQLQNAVDATALAIAQNMPNDFTGYCQAVGSTSPDWPCSTVLPTAPDLGYGGVKGAANQLFGYGVTADPQTVTFVCSAAGPDYDGGQCPQGQDTSTQDQPDKLCRPGDSAGPLTGKCNAVTVEESATVSSTLANIFGWAKFTLHASATASAPNGGTAPFDIAVVVDSTASMNDRCDDDVPGIPQGRSDKIDCAKEGVRTLLSGLWPCDPSLQDCGGATPLDEASLVTFPALKDPEATTHDTTGALTNLQLETQCEGQYPATPPWYTPNKNFPTWYLSDSDTTYANSADYVIAPLSNDYKASAASGLNTTSSPIVSAVDWNTCPTGYPGNEYYGLNVPACNSACTYYAGAIDAAQAELEADKARGAQPVIILLSDGDANIQAPGQCTRAVQAAQNAAAQGTQVYSIMYGQTSTRGGCAGDGRYTAYTAMQAIASDPGKFYCDPQPTGANCQSAATLNDIFAHIIEAISKTRLVG